MKGRTVLVTGAGGFVGAHLTRTLTERGARVHGLGDDPPQQALPLAGWHPVDLRDRPALDSAMGAVRPDAVAHLAGRSSAARSFEDPLGTFEVNVLGTWNLLESVRRVCPQARVLVVGSGEAYGPIPPGTRATEDTPQHPVSPYGHSKSVADALAAAHGQAHGIDVVRTRSFAHAGPGQDARFLIPSVAGQIAAIEAGRSEPVLRVGNLEVTRDLCDVRDVAGAYADLIERGARGGVYNVCRGEGATLVGVVEWLVARSRVPIRVERDPLRMRPADVPYLVGDPSAIARDVGWHATVLLEETLQGVLDEWRARPPGVETGPP